MWDAFYETAGGVRYGLTADYTHAVAVAHLPCTTRSHLLTWNPTPVVTAGGGAPLYEWQSPEPTMQASNLIDHFVLVEIDGDRLYVTVIDRDGQAHDTFDLPRNTQILHFL